MNKELVRTIIAIIVVLAFAFGNMSIANASTKSDLSLAKSWAKSHYNTTIKVVNEYKVPSNRNGICYIEKVQTKSKGGYNGRTIKGNYSVKYPKKVKKGKKITIYLVYNPNSNYSDDVIAMVCLGKVK